MRLLAVNIFVLFMVLCSPVLAQNSDFKCPWNEVDCPGKCGRFFDGNSDGFCDYRILSAQIENVVDETNIKVETPKTNISKANTTQSKDSVVDSPADTAAKKASTQQVKQPKSTPVSNKRSYSLLLISLLCFGLYGFTSYLMELKVFRKFVHRRIWNVLLLLTFLGSAVLGIMLVVLINYDMRSELFLDYLYWHVQVGIAMSVIALIHIVWHWKYFRNLFSRKTKTDC